MSISVKIKSFFLKKIASKKSNIFDIREAKSVLFLRYDRIGDMVITTPVFRELKLACPHIKITVLASKVNQGVLLNNPYIDYIVTNHKNNLLKDLPSLLKLRKQQFDVCVEFDHSVIPHAILRLKIIKPKKVISVKKDGRYGVAGSELSLYDFYTKKPINTHFRDIWLGTLKPFCINPKSNNYDLFTTDNQQKKAQDFINQYPSKLLIGINLEGFAKSRSIEYSDLWEICQGLHEANNDIKVIILTTPNNLQSVKQKVTNSSLDYVVTSYKTNEILDVAALISQLDLVITPDTSIVHIASTYNIPIVTINKDGQDSYKLFSSVSKISKTIFSNKKDSLKGYSISELIKYSNKFLQNKG